MSDLRQPRLTTERLVLVAGDGECGRAELVDRKRLADLIGARVPPEWPPPLNDEASMTWFTEHAEANPDAIGWGMWYFLRRDSDGELVAVGNGGFKGRPDPDGSVEIGYSVLEAHQRQGYASEAVRALVGWAFGHSQVKRVLAHTLPDSQRSIRVLEKCGFVLLGVGAEEGTVLFELGAPGSVE
ncbi:MAG: GNAT family N-acetyltransferase [bacterium]|nr:GNAT family N-acetyltransferase [bacterium]